MTFLDCFLFFTYFKRKNRFVLVCIHGDVPKKMEGGLSRFPLLRLGNFEVPSMHDPYYMIILLLMWQIGWLFNAFAHILYSVEDVGVC